MIIQLHRIEVISRNDMDMIDITPEVDAYFDRFPDALAPDFFRPEACHQTNNQSAHNGDRNHPQAQDIVGRRLRRGRPRMEEENVGEKPDELEQGISGYGT